MKALKLLTGICLTIIVECSLLKAQQSKFQKWQQPSYFNGFNMSVWDNYDNREVNQEDFDSLKAIGATVVSIQTQGSLDVNPPYAASIYYTDGIDTIFYIDMLDSMVGYARNAGLSYVICVRDGPGRIDVSDGGISSIWTNSFEQQLYGKMLKGMAKRYLPDTLFVGMDLTVEPNPLDSIVEPMISELDSALRANNIDVNAIYALWIDSVRTVDADLPLMVEGVYMSDPEYFSLVSKQSDNKIVYKVHIYNPPDFTHPDTSFSSSYPGNYWSVRMDDMVYFDKAFMKDSLVDPVRNFELTYKVPVMVGELGLRYPQTGGKQYLTDIAEIACELGWHYTLWGFNDGPQFNYKDLDAIYGTDYWNTVKSLMNCGFTSIEERTNANGSINLYPNPTNGSFTIEFGKIYSRITVKLINLSGHMVSNTEYLNTFIIQERIEGVPGIYLVRVITDDGKSVSFKILKE